MITFGLFGVVFLGLGIMLYVLSDKIQELSLQYDSTEFCGPPGYKTTKAEGLNQAIIGADGKTCLVNLTITAKMEGPVFVYYQLDNFYQNHRRYVKSRDYRQLMGETRTIGEVKTPCDPIY